MKIIENILPAQLYLNTVDFINKNGHDFGWASGTNEYKHFGKDYCLDGTFNTLDVENYEKIPVELLNVWFFLKQNVFKNKVLIRIHTAVHTHGIEGQVHRDCYRPNEQTAIIYLNDKWNYSWSGETVFFDEEKEITKSVLPRPNRGVIFRSFLEHCSRPISRECDELRITLMFKVKDSTDELRDYLQHHIQEKTFGLIATYDKIMFYINNQNYALAGLILDSKHRQTMTKIIIEACEKFNINSTEIISIVNKFNSIVDHDKVYGINDMLLSFFIKGCKKKTPTLNAWFVNFSKKKEKDVIKTYSV